ncbi:hypothetical protein QP888_10280 [Corynebacterium sp. MSK297]|uniref:hypothetical protein n=1 Tax=Corynebacterium TaxID=1716 RepID=UPI002543B8D5|nr:MULTISPECIES: hypothetical protein [Corynebacterium]MDK4252040.1 hypothetical protein [Corynebacterium propinquum]MDK8846866.1 hypothetical protein [Corynebacterium sp. MSK297]
MREFQLNAASVVTATGGIGGNLAKVRASWPHHSIRIIPGPSALWLDATGTRFPTTACWTASVSHGPEISGR